MCHNSVGIAASLYMQCSVSVQSLPVDCMLGKERDVHTMNLHFQTWFWHFCLTLNAAKAFRCMARWHRSGDINGNALLSVCHRIKVKSSSNADLSMNNSFYGFVYNIEKEEKGGCQRCKYERCLENVCVYMKYPVSFSKWILDRIQFLTSALHQRFSSHVFVPIHFCTFLFFWGTSEFILEPYLFLIYTYLQTPRIRIHHVM